MEIQSFHLSLPCPLSPSWHGLAVAAQAAFTLDTLVQWLASAVITDAGVCTLTPFEQYWDMTVREERFPQKKDWRGRGGGEDKNKGKESWEQKLGKEK